MRRPPREGRYETCGAAEAPTRAGTGRAPERLHLEHPAQEVGPAPPCFSKLGRSEQTSPQSDNPDSPNHANQTLLFSKRQSKPTLFKERDIRADPKLQVVELCRTATGGACS